MKELMQILSLNLSKFTEMYPILLVPPACSTFQINELQNYHGNA